MVKISEEKIKEALNRGTEKAKEFVSDDGKMQQLLDSLEEKLRTIPELGDELAYVPVFASMLRYRLAGEYKELPTRTVLLIVSALLYVITPIDIIPDAIPMGGYADDIAVVLACAKYIKPDLDRFIEWRDAQISADVTTD